MDLGRTLKKARVQKKISQMEMAKRSHVSLATIQNLESGRANPAWNTVMALCRVLGFKIELHHNPIDWTLLATLGCPILQEADRSQMPSRTQLIDFLISFEPSQLDQQLEDRQRQSLTGWLQALRDHYPSLWKQTKVATRKWLDTEKTTSIKLRRLSLSQLAVYL